MIGPVQEIPMYEARIVLHKTKKDAFGMPMLATQGGKHPLTVKQSNIMSDTAKAVLEEAGAMQTWKINSDQGLAGAMRAASTRRAHAEWGIIPNIQSSIQTAKFGGPKMFS